MTMVNTSQELIGEALNDDRVHAFLFAEPIHELLEVVFKILENEDEFAIGVNDFSEAYNIGVGEFLENGYFADGCGGYSFFF